MQVGDLVRYMGWGNLINQGPMGIVVDQTSSDTSFHHRIRVMWVDNPPPVQAQALSISGERITTWVSPKHFEIVSKAYKEGEE
tara:strand:- start:5014 stop:5262 length:249 start_codon:yes stop_codon:yes gene_type:complete